MAQQTDQQHLYELIEQLEVNLKEFKQALGAMPRSTKKRRTVKKSLYGIFPRANTPMADFREARKSWSRHWKDF